MLTETNGREGRSEGKSKWMEHRATYSPVGHPLYTSSLSCACLSPSVPSHPSTGSPEMATPSQSLEAGVCLLASPVHPTWAVLSTGLSLAPLDSLLPVCLLPASTPFWT